MAKEDRGFASMDRSKQREIASKGGKAAHQKGHGARVDERRSARGRAQGRHGEPSAQAGAASSQATTEHEHDGPSAAIEQVGGDEPRSTVAGLAQCCACLTGCRSASGYNRKFSPRPRRDWYWEVVQR